LDGDHRAVPAGLGYDLVCAKINFDGCIADPPDGAAPPDSETVTPQHIPMT
jgi:hypothetical protein